jgi:RNA-directed DNA polymerase
MQLELFNNQNRGTFSLEEVFAAYYECRKHKRNTANALAFEVDFESRCIELWRDINSGEYEIGKSIAFIVTKPVKREVFAADFRDRIVHHLIIAKINSLLEKSFIDNSFSCREGKGTLFGVKKIAEMVKQCSENYTKDCYILKMDIKSFFMNIKKKLLFSKLKSFLEAHYQDDNLPLIMELIDKVIYNTPENNCIVKGHKSDWNDLPKSKSLFSGSQKKGLPIGNLTSQIFANFYLNSFDHFLTDKCDIKYYGRYVDDFIIVHNNKQFLKDIVPVIKDFLKRELGLMLHPNKIYLQHYSKGVKFIGAVIKPHREYIGNRTKGNLWLAINNYKKMWFQCSSPNQEILQKLVNTVNSYFGFMIHYKSFYIRNKVCKKFISPVWKKFIKTPKLKNKIGIAGTA